MSNEKAAAIQVALSQIEEDHHVHILYACESGSRAWGFASTSSDYDVRFIYARHPLEYLRLDIPRDVIELPIQNDLDINGWDIFKALRLLRKSNPPLLEWLTSPITYRGNNSLATLRLRDIAQRNFSVSTMVYHYWHMARGNWRQYLHGKSEVLLKKYLYVLRPIATLRYLEQTQSLPPVNITETLAAIHLADNIHGQILNLIERKQAGDEMGLGKADPTLHCFIEAEMERIEQQFVPKYNAQRRTTLNQECEKWLSDVLDTVANIACHNKGDNHEAF